MNKEQAKRANIMGVQYFRRLWLYVGINRSGINFVYSFIYSLLNFLKICTNFSFRLRLCHRHRQSTPPPWFGTEWGNIQPRLPPTAEWGRYKYDNGLCCFRNLRQPPCFWERIRHFAPLPPTKNPHQTWQSFFRNTVSGINNVFSSLLLWFTSSLLIPWHKKKLVEIYRGILAAVTDTPPPGGSLKGMINSSARLYENEYASRCRHFYQGHIQGQGGGGSIPSRSTLTPTQNKI